MIDYRFFMATLFIVFTLNCAPKAEFETELTPQEVSVKKQDDRPIILALGNSLTAAYGLDMKEGWTSHIQHRLDTLGYNYRVINAGVSGETTSGLKSRINWMLQGPVEIAIVESGANDGLRGTDLLTTQANLEAIIDSIRVFKSDIQIILAGMMVPMNMGPEYTKQFERIYPEVAKKKKTILIPFFLENVGGIPDLNLPDGIHPNEKGQKIVTETVWKYVYPLLKK